jgi:hypothetical protein
MPFRKISRDVKSSNSGPSTLMNRMYYHLNKSLTALVRNWRCCLTPLMALLLVPDFSTHPSSLMTWFSTTSLAHISTKNAWIYLIDGIVLEFLPSVKVVLRLCPSERLESFRIHFQVSTAVSDSVSKIEDIATGIRGKDASGCTRERLWLTRSPMWLCRAFFIYFLIRSNHAYCQPFCSQL